MKKLLLIIAIIIAASLGFIGCVTEGPTELAFKNSNLSDGAINDIVWVQDNIEWSKTGGYDKEATTHSQEVDSLTSTVDCTVLFGAIFVAADVYFPASGTNTLALEESTAYIFTLEATPAK